MLTLGAAGAMEHDWRSESEHERLNKGIRRIRRGQERLRRHVEELRKAQEKLRRFIEDMRQANGPVVPWWHLRREQR